MNERQEDIDEPVALSSNLGSGLNAGLSRDPFTSVAPYLHHLSLPRTHRSIQKLRCRVKSQSIELVRWPLLGVAINRFCSPTGRGSSSDEGAVRWHCNRTFGSSKKSSAWLWILAVRANDDTTKNEPDARLCMLGKRGSRCHGLQLKGLSKLCRSWTTREKA